MIKMYKVCDKTPPSNVELLVLSPEGTFYLSSFREGYNIFTCQTKGEDCSDWYWCELNIETVKKIKIWNI